MQQKNIKIIKSLYVFVYLPKHDFELLSTFFQIIAFIEFYHPSRRYSTSIWNALYLCQIEYNADKCSTALKRLFFISLFKQTRGLQKDMAHNSCSLQMWFYLLLMRSTVDLLGSCQAIWFKASATYFLQNGQMANKKCFSVSSMR